MTARLAADRVGAGGPLRALTRDRAALLEQLVVEGTVTLSMRYGGTGRPEHLYAWPP